VPETPEEFWRQTDHPQPHLDASADLPPEVIQFDNQIPLLAGEGTDRRLHPPPEIVEELHNRLEREAEIHNQLRHGNETHFEVHSRPQLEQQQSQYEPADNLQPTEFQPGEFQSYHSDEAAHDGADGYTPLEHRAFLADGEKTARTGVSGPSFLGLTDDVPTDPDDPYEDPETALEPESHLWRNIGVAVLACAVTLISMEWHSISEVAVALLQNGSMTSKATVPHNSSTIVASNISREIDHAPGIPPASAQADSPQALDNSPNAGHSLPVPPADSAPNSEPPASTSNGTRVSPSRQQPPAMSAPVTDEPRNDLPNNDVRDDERSKNLPTHVIPTIDSSAASIAPHASRTNTHRTPRTAPLAGASEMNRAASTSDAATRAAWLWRAVGKGNPQAPIELARMYELGNGVTQNCDQAKILLRLAASKGSEQARLNLQQIRFRGACSSQ